MGAKYIFVTGGVTSSLGKGIIASSLGMLLKARGLNICIKKLDPYINVDPGTINPYEHGECYVTEDGAETDLDLGHYERFLNQPTSKDCSVTAGKIYQSVIQKERRGEFLGKTVQVVPHITSEIKQAIVNQEEDYDLIIIEVGGTVGDMESLPFIEAVRQIQWEKGRNSAVIHLTLLPHLSATGELKTKPTQHSVKLLMQAGLRPDIIVCRSEKEVSLSVRKKIALFCSVHESCVVPALDLPNIYEVPKSMHKHGLDVETLRILDMEALPGPQLQRWDDFLGRYLNPKKKIKISLVGKYVELRDAYKSIIEALTHAATSHQIEAEIDWVHVSKISNGDVECLAKSDGIIVAPGFGERGLEGKLAAVKYARENHIPFLGICLGLQIACIEFARNVLEIKAANSEEFVDHGERVISRIDSIIPPEMGGTMRLGAWDCTLKQGSLARKIYDKDTISERHRHRFEFNPNYLSRFERHGMIASGINPKTKLVEILELVDHPWFLSVQFHPEYKSTVLEPHPVFVSFIAAASADR